MLLDSATLIGTSSLNGILNIDGNLSSSNIITITSSQSITSSYSQNSNNSVSSSYVKITNVDHFIQTINNNYTVTNTANFTLLCNATSGSFNVVLPSPVGNTNVYNIKKIDLSGNCIHVSVTDSSLIDYDTTQSICNKGTNLTIQSNGETQYYIL